MRVKVNIYVEGNDSHFIEQYISVLDINPTIEYKVIATKGKDRIYERAFLIELDKATSIEGVNLIVFDANGQDIKLRKEKILQRLKKESEKNGFKIKIDGIFLLPNDSESGTLESLLLNIMNPKHANPILECFESYNSCIQKKGYYPVNDKEINKVKVYCYLQSLDREDKEIAKDKNRNYIISDHWDLQHQYLSPLKKFLLPFLKS